MQKLDKIEFTNSFINKKFNNIFKQVDMYVINFGEEIEMSLHCCTFFRIIYKNEILFTSNDEFYSPRFRYLTEERYNRDELNKYSLMVKALVKTRKALKNHYITNVVLENYGDLKIFFDNQIEIQIIIDRRSKNYEYYRLIKYYPNFKHWKKSLNKKTIHYVCRFSNQEIDFFEE